MLSMKGGGRHVVLRPTAATPAAYLRLLKHNADQRIADDEGRTPLLRSARKWATATQPDC